ncbi:unnamed protein product [Lota lota]
MSAGFYLHLCSTYPSAKPFLCSAVKSNGSHFGPGADQAGALLSLTLLEPRFLLLRHAEETGPSCDSQIMPAPLALVTLGSSAHVSPIQKGFGPESVIIEEP